MESKLKQSQNRKILKYLQEGNELTSLQALNLFGTLRLASRIFELREDHEILDETIMTDTGKKVKKYYMKVKPPVNFKPSQTELFEEYKRELL